MPAAIRALFDNLKIMSGGNLGVNYDIAPTNEALAVIRDTKGDYAAHAMRFGLWEPWMDKSKKRYATFNARWETVKSSRMFGPLWSAGQRCAVPASGWYEWSGPKSDKRRWHFSLGEPDGLFWFGGLYQTAQTDEGEERRSFSLLTVPANDTVGRYHSTERDPGGRMPVILESGQLERWLDPAADPDDMIQTWPDDQTSVWEVPRKAVGFAQAQHLSKL